MTPDDAADPFTIARTDQLTAATRDLAELTSGYYRALRRRGVPRRLAAELVRDAAYAALTGERRA